MSKRTESSQAKSLKPGLRGTTATSEGTKRFASRFGEQYVPDFYRSSRSLLTVSSVGLGTYLGDSNDATDALYTEAAQAALAAGINIIDTAINYRCQRSERVIGKVLQEMMDRGVIRRDEIVLCSKAGYVPLDGTPPGSREEYDGYLRREYFEPGILHPRDLVAGGHAITPAFLTDQLSRSLRNLGVQGIDYFYLHNPEQQLAAVPPEEFRKRMRAAFEALEGLASRGLIGAYGCATWSGLRLPAESQGHLSLYELVSIATEVAGADHHFHVVQLPINLSMSEAVRISTQRDRKGRLIHLLDAAAELGIDVVASAPLLQGQLTRGLPVEVRDLFTGRTDAQRSLAFVRTLPAVLAAAVGMKTAEHVTENLENLRV
jgi:aryl-alcohol dehydrogenase-like predicted oxidoreductase